MKKLVERFIGEKCIITAFDSSHVCIIKEVTDGAVLAENNGQIEVINLDFVLRIREYPKNKKNKEKSVVLN